MEKHTLYYATNRNYVGKDRWHPTRYGAKFSDDGIENLRFGIVTVEAEEQRIEKFLDTMIRDCGKGDGLGLSGYLSRCARRAKIEAYEEKIDPEITDTERIGTLRGRRGCIPLRPKAGRAELRSCTCKRGFPRMVQRVASRECVGQ